jgi:lysophospholipase L1-like esterase
MATPNREHGRAYSVSLPAVAVTRVTAARTTLALVFALLLAVAVPVAAQAAKDGKQKKSGEQFYVSLGDSYSVGYQPGPAGQPGTSTKAGYAYVLPKLARKRGYDLELVNFGCAQANPVGTPETVGETTATILERTTPCLISTIGGPDYSGKTQIAAAENFIKKHRRAVRLITVSVGGNDVTPCASSPDPFGCLVTAVENIKKNLSVLVQRLNAAASKQTLIVGLTYPDVLLGLWVSGEQSDRDLAAASVVGFRDFLNPALKEQYDSVDGVFVDVTAATDAYVPLEQTTVYPPYGEVPIAVATVCRLTYFCERRDIHANEEGYRYEAELIAEVLPKKKKK